MAVAKRLHLRAFLEGIEIPVIAATVSIYTNSSAAASVQVVPVDSGMDLMPRTMIHLFFFNQRVNDYCLLFSGEVIGFAFQQTPQSRSLVLQCVDFSNYWDSAHVTALEYGTGGNAFTDTGAVWASNVSLIDDIVSHQSEKLVSWLKQKPKTPGLQTVSGLAGGIIRMLEAIGGVPGHEKGINDFFTIAQLRCRILEQITAEENDDTAAKLLSVQVFDEWLRNGLQNMGQQVTFRDLLKLLFRYIYYDMVPNPAAMFVAASTGEQKAGNDKYYVLKDMAVGKRCYEVLDSELSKLIDRTNSRDPTLFAIQVAHTSFFNLTSVKTDLVTAKKVTPTLAADVARVLSPIERALSALQTMETRGEVSAWTDFAPIRDAVREARSNLEAAQTKVKDPGLISSKAQTQRLHTQFFRPDCWFAVPPTCNVIFPEQFVQVSFERNYLSEVTRTLMQVFPSLVGPDRLLSNRILAPNITDTTKSLAGAAGQASYRVLMEHEYHTGIIPREEWLPDTSAVQKDASPADKAQTKNQRLTWSQRIALFHFFKYRFAGRQIQVSGRFNPNVVCGFPGALLRAPFLPDMNEVAALSKLSTSSETSSALLSFIADHSTELNGPDHFIGMVASVTHSLDQQGGTTAVTFHHVRRHTGTDDEFLRIAQQVEFKSTEKVVKVVLRYADVKGMPERLQVLAAITPVVAGETNIVDAEKFKTTAPTSTSSIVDEEKFRVARRDVTLASVQQTLTEVNPDTGVLEEVTSTSSVPISANSEQTPDVAPPRTQRATLYDGRTALSPSPPGKLSVGGEGILPGGKIVSIEVLSNGSVSYDPRYGICFDEVVLYEKITVPISGSVPVEEILRPRGWFSPKYASTAIGESIYRPFLGCQSIIDALSVELSGKEIQVQAPPDDVPVVSGSKTDLVSSVAAIAGLETQRLTYTAERSLSALAYLYGLVKKQRLDVDGFIESYTARPIATMQQILGDPNLVFDIDGNRVKLSKNSPGKFIGFHTMAVNETLVSKGNLTGLVDDLATGLPRIDGTGDVSPIPAEYDVRQEKKDQVKEYVYELNRGPGFKG